MQATEQNPPSGAKDPWRMPRLLSVGFPLSLIATIGGTIAFASAGPAVVLAITAIGFTAGVVALTVGTSQLHKQTVAAISQLQEQLGISPEQKTKTNHPQPKKEKKTMTSPAQEQKSSSAANGLVAAAGAFLISLFALATQAPQTPEKDKKTAETAYVHSVAILNKEEERSRPSNPKKPAQKNALRALYNRVVPRVIGKVVNKPQGRPYPQTHIKRGACNNLRVS